MPLPSVAEILRAHPPAAPIGRDAAHAAVLALLRTGAEGPEVLLIQRPHRTGDPASGQVSFPGGHVEPDDSSIMEAALREATEEVGVGVEDLAGPVRFAGIGAAFAERIPVGVFVAELRGDAGPPRRASPGEVDELFWLPLGRVDPPARVRVASSRGPREVDATVFEGHVVWGFTRNVLVSLLAPGATAPSPARPAPGPASPPP
ncbi:MAG: NUDIX domain-containing protein [Thermoplasmata archaeon]